MANTKNLIPQAHVLTVEELSKGGTNSAFSRRNRKRLREELEMLLEIGELLKNTKIKAYIDVFGRCMKNTALISHRDSLTSEMVEKF